MKRLLAWIILTTAGLAFVAPIIYFIGLAIVTGNTSDLEIIGALLCAITLAIGAGWAAAELFP